MISYKCSIDFWRDDVHIKTDKVITIEEDIIIEDDFERQELISDILLEKLKEKFDEYVELIEFEELTDKDYHIYKLTY